jgi:hypothetical protein
MRLGGGTSRQGAARFIRSDPEREIAELPLRSKALLEPKVRGRPKPRSSARSGHAYAFVRIGARAGSLLAAASAANWSCR